MSDFCRFLDELVDSVLDAESVIELGADDPERAIGIVRELVERFGVGVARALNTLGQFSRDGPVFQ